MTPYEMGQALREARRAQGLSQQALARLAGLSRSSVYRLESGESDGMALSALYQLCDALGLELGLNAQSTPSQAPEHLRPRR